MDEQSDRSSQVQEQTASIFQLPPEILRTIFLLHQAQCRGSGHVYDGDNLEWIRLGHVCRYWRELFIDYTHLWTTIRIKDLTEKVSSFLEIQLERTKGHVVDLEVFGPNVYGRNGSIEQFVDLIVSLVPRLRSLQLTSDADSVASDLLQKLRELPAPELESFSISVRCSVPDDIFNREAPQLRRVGLSHILALPSSDSVFLNRNDSLTHLELRSIANFASEVQTPSWIQVHKLIQSQENTLKMLHIHSSLPDAPKLIRERPLLQLPQLTELSLGGASRTVRAVLRAMRIPPTARVSLDVEMEFDFTEENWNTFPPFNANMNLDDNEEGPPSPQQIDINLLDVFEALSTARSSTPLEFTHLKIQGRHEKVTSPIRLQGWIVGSQETGSPSVTVPLHSYYKPYHILPVDPPPSLELSFAIPNWDHLRSEDQALRVATYFPLSTSSTSATTTTGTGAGGTGGLPGVGFSRLRALDVGAAARHGGHPLELPRTFWENVQSLMSPTVEMVRLQNLEVGEFVRVLKDDGAFPSLKALLLEGSQLKSVGNAFVDEIKRRDGSGRRLECLDFGIKCEFGTPEEEKEAFGVLEKCVDDFNGYWRLVRQGHSNFWRLPSVKKPYPYRLSQ
ncbi:hypothetical protein EST38_g4754 [Candolleomyces aberdarensis]|uniref:F-box domain-containing protein n=1 Tax=Candolleomyces aberdarensis TaxID=2316362 RepID=A0A4Q2DQ42_9AGAR|nr:hypothetical protein EST38_g4754 [Candolleomyces aberdarensis]